MRLDWFTVIAQVINFLVLVYLLKRFLYGPIIDAMDQREAKIVGRLQDAERSKVEAKHEAETFRQQTQELNKNRQDLLTQAEQEAAGRKKELIHQARADVSEQQARWRESLRQEKESFIKEFRQRSSDEFWSLARRVLSELANAELERHIVDVFVQRLIDLDEDGRAGAVAAIREAGDSVVVQSAFPLPAPAQGKVTEAVRTQLDSSLGIRFEVAPEVVAGIEIKAPGHKMAWSVGDYLRALEEKLSAVIAEEIARTGVVRAEVDDEASSAASPREVGVEEGDRTGEGAQG